MFTIENIVYWGSVAALVAFPVTFITLIIFGTKLSRKYTEVKIESDIILHTQMQNFIKSDKTQSVKSDLGFFFINKIIYYRTQSNRMSGYSIINVILSGFSALMSFEYLQFVAININTQFYSIKPFYIYLSFFLVFAFFTLYLFFLRNKYAELAEIFHHTLVQVMGIPIDKDIERPVR